MSRGTTTGGNYVFIRISSGKIVESVSEKTPNASQRTNKVGKVVYERIDDFVSGIITSMHHEQKEYEGEPYESLFISLSDGPEKYKLELRKGSKYWVKLMEFLPSLDLRKPVTIIPYDFIGKNKDGGPKKVTGLNCYQEGKKIPSFYPWSPEDPGEVPQGKSQTFGGKEFWDFSERDEFFTNKFNGFAIELQSLQPAEPLAVNTEPMGNEPARIAAALPVRGDQIVGNDEDDLPF